ncbi:MAG: sulfatase-like hydrolase/transferase [Rhodanobacteraceae bacterium]|nr:sulfatase-like hydrolase/transferase [Rhodanobacteraceae bacterium]
MTTRPNILLVLVDQMRMPPSQPNLGPRLEQLNQVLSFDPQLKDDNPFLAFFPAFRRLRRHSVRLARHQIASAACVPSRASLITGQYPSRHLVTQTAGMFKQEYDPGFPWLPDNQVPTIGDWFRAAGYTTHYFGRHDFTTPPGPSLQEWGFSDWSSSWPSSQGGGPGNLGVFRDIGFVDVSNTFFNRQALGFSTNVRNLYNSTNATTAQTPWFAVASFVNPHDITGWPLPWLGGVQSLPAREDAPEAADVFERIGALLRGSPATIPTRCDRSEPPAGGTYQVWLNPDDFPQDNSVLSPNWNSDLSTKPTCQLEASYKISQGFLAQWPRQLWPVAPLPYKSAPRAEAWLLAHLQAYVYFHYLVNLEIDKVLANLERNGLLDQTIVVFTSDHGEMGGAHGGQIEKWHNAYRETIHVPFVVSSPLVNPSRDQMREIDSITSHIDLAPTLLGLAGYHEHEQPILKSLILGHEVYDLPGRDLSFAITGKPAAPERHESEGVLFVSQDEITLPTDRNSLPATFVNYLQIVKNAIDQGKQQTTEGPIVQPNHVYAYCEAQWKLVRYIDGRRSEAASDPPQKFEADQWELYCLGEDPGENINLVSWRDGQPVPEPGRIPEGWSLTPGALLTALDRLQKALAADMVRVGYAADGGPAQRSARPATQQFVRHDFNAP